LVMIVVDIIYKTNVHAYQVLASLCMMFPIICSNCYPKCANLSKDRLRQCVTNFFWELNALSEVKSEHEWPLRPRIE
jgi:hypothetical protein